MRVAIDESGQRCLATSVHTLELGSGWDLPQHLLRRTDRDDPVSRDGYRGWGIDAQFSELVAAERSRPGRRDGGVEVVDQEPDFTHPRHPSTSARDPEPSPTGLYREASSRTARRTRGRALRELSAGWTMPCPDMLHREIA